MSNFLTSFGYYYFNGLKALMVGLDACEFAKDNCWPLGELSPNWDPKVAF